MLRAVVLSGAYLCLVGLIGLAAGMIVRHGAAAITAVVALVFVAPLAGLAATPAGQYLPELIYANALGATKPVQGFTLSPVGRPRDHRRLRRRPAHRRRLAAHPSRRLGP